MALQCSIDAGRAIQEKLKEAFRNIQEGALSEELLGGSKGFQEALFKHYIRIQATPEKLETIIDARVSALENPFHISFVKNGGEEFFIGGKLHYLFNSTVRQEQTADGNPIIDLVLVDADNIADQKTFTFDTTSDTAYQADKNNKEVVFKGISEIILNSIKTEKKPFSPDNLDVVIDDGGDVEIGNKLEQISIINALMGSKHSLTPDSLIEYEEMTNYEHGNIESMRSMMHKLHLIGGETATSQELLHFNNLFNQMSPKFFNGLKLYIKTASDNTLGRVNLVGDSAKSIQIEIAKKEKQPYKHMSEAETYVHEVVHTMVSWAFRQPIFPTRQLKERLNHALKVALDHVTWEDFLTVDKDVATGADKNIAKDKFKTALLSSKHADEEFLVYALTNLQFGKKLKTILMSDGKGAKVKPETVFERVMDVFKGIWNRVFGSVDFNKLDTNLYEEVHKIAFALAEVNNEGLATIDREGYIGKLAKVLLIDSDKSVSDFLSTVAKTIGDKVEDLKPLSENASAYQKAKYYLQLITRGITNPIYRSKIGLLASAYYLKPEGTVREIVRGFFEKDAVAQTAQKLRLLATNIEALRNGVIRDVTRSIKKAFNEPLSEEEDIAITSVLLDTNVAALRYERQGRTKYADADLVRYLRDNEELIKRINNLKTAMKKEFSKTAPDQNTLRAQWTIQQSISLGYKMATGKGTVATNSSSYGIASGWGYTRNYEISGVKIALIEELASLTALMYTDKKDKELVANLLDSQNNTQEARGKRQGISVITDTYQMYVAHSKNTIFNKNLGHMQLGHTKDLFDDSVQILIEPMTKKEELEKQGFKLAYTNPIHKNLSRAEPTGVFIGGVGSMRERERGVIGLGKFHASGTTLTEIRKKTHPEYYKFYHANDMNSMAIEAQEIHRAMAEGKFKPEDYSQNYLPLFDPTGKVVDYRAVMSKENKIKFLKPRRRSSEVLPRSFASVQYQIEEEELNEEALKFLLKNMEKNWEEGDLGEDGAEYIVLGPNAETEEGRELFMMLPDTLRNAIYKRADKSLAIRRTELKIWLGGKHFKTTDIVGLNLLPGVIKQGIDMLEVMWMDIVKISKGIILLKMPAILIANFVSNILYQIANGHIDLRELLNDYRDSFKDINEYIKIKRTATALQVEVNQNVEALERTKNKEKFAQRIETKKQEIARLNALLARNPAHELFLAGMYQTHVEEVEASGLGESNRVSSRAEKLLERLPKPVKRAAEISYLTSTTAWYKFAEETLQRTDMIARLVHNKRLKREEIEIIKGKRDVPEWWKKAKGEKYPTRKVMSIEEAGEFKAANYKARMETLIESYINYTLPNGMTEEYLNRMGLLMFTKYLKRIQRVISNNYAEHPLKSTLALLVAGVGLDLNVVQQESLLASGFDLNGDFSPLNIVPTYGLLFHIENVLTPALLKEETYLNMF